MHSMYNNANRSRWLASLLFVLASIAFADKATEPSDDFLAYLGDMEDSDDNWSDFADQNDPKANAHADQASSTSSASSQSRDTVRSASTRSRT